MARTDAGATLTAKHRQAQITVRAQALRDYLRLWPVWTGDDASFTRLIVATVALVRAYHGASRVLSAEYFEQFRRVEKVPGTPPVRLGPDVDVDRVVAALRVTGQGAVRDALLAGKPPEKAMQTALVRTSGSVTRHVLAGGRDTVVLSTGEDRKATGWARVTDDDPCPFCRLLASRGAVYKGESTAEFQAHDACACTAEPAYDGWRFSPASKRFHDEYKAAVRQAREAGDLRRGTDNDLLNAYRRYLAGQQQQS